MGWPLIADLRTVRLGVYGARDVGELNLRRIYTIFAEAGNYGAFLVCNLPLVLGCSLSKDQNAGLRLPVGWWPNVVLLIALANIFLTGARLAWLMVPLAVLVTFLLAEGTLSVVRVAAWVGIVFLAAALTSHWSDSSIDFGSLGSYVKSAWTDLSGWERRYFLEMTPRILEESPLLGIGFGGEAAFAHYRWVGVAYRQIVVVLGMWPYLLAGSGFLGTLVFAGFVSWHLRRGLGARGGQDCISIVRGWLRASLVLLAAVGVFQNPLVNAYFWTVLGILAGTTRPKSEPWRMAILAGRRQ